MENGERCNDCHGEGKEVDWGNPLTRVLLHRVIAWPSFREAAGGLDRAAIPVLAQLIDHRNRTTGQCNPSRNVWRGNGVLAAKREPGDGRAAGRGPHWQGTSAVPGMGRDERLLADAAVF